jgi:hypothetical protein
VKKTLILTSIILSSVLPLAGCRGSAAATPSPKLVGQWKLEGLQGRVSCGPGITGKVGGKDYLFVWVVSADVEDTIGTSNKIEIAILDLQNRKKVAYLEAPRAYGFGALVLSDTVLYAQEGSYLWVLDVSNPSVPQELSQLSSIYVGSMAISSKYAYIYDNLHNAGGITIVDISDPAHLQVIGNSELLPPDLANGLNRLATSGSLLLALSGRALGIFDISSPRSPKMVGYFPNTDPGSYLIAPTVPTHKVTVPAQFFDIAIAGKCAYIAASGPDGMRVIDISDPSSPHQVANLKTAQGVGSIFISGNLTYLTTGDTSTGMFYPTAALDIIDISNPDNPRKISSAVLPSSEFAVANNHIFGFVGAHPIGSSPVIEITDLHLPSK